LTTGQAGSHPEQASAERGRAMRSIFDKRTAVNIRCRGGCVERISRELS